MKKLINIMLIAFLVLSNFSISPTSAKEGSHSKASEVNLYNPDSNEDLVLYEESELKEELTHVQNNSPALLLETDEETNASLVEIELNEEKLTGYIHTDTVFEQEEYKLYTEKKADSIQVYSDGTLKDALYELADETSVLVNQKDLEVSIDAKKDYVFISLNPETEAIPEDLVEKIKKVEDIQGFVEIKHLVSLEDEAAFLEKRNQDSKKEADLAESEVRENADATEEDASESEAKENEEATEEDASESEARENADATEEDASESEAKENEEVTEEDSSESEAKEKEDATEEDSSELEAKEKEEATEENSDESEKKEKVESEKIEQENQAITTFSMMRSSPKVSSTSRLGHIRGGNRLIYKTIGGKSFKATSKHRNAVYYIKRQAKVGKETFYLLSTSPSATRGVVGWMKAKDLSIHSHTGVTRTPKQITIKGTGRASSKALGGSKDIVHKSMSHFKGQTFYVNLTEKVGNNTWYRGKINNKGTNVWLHSNQTEKLQVKKSRTSRLGHIKGGNRLIYETLDGKSFKASSKHWNAVYYIKRQAKVGKETFYLLSTSPSATRGVVGWMKAKDLSIHSHTGVTRTPKQITIKGTGRASSKAWGGSKDIVHKSMNTFADQTFFVNLTEKVGNNTWYRGKIRNKGANVWLHSSQTEKLQVKESRTSRLGHIKGGNRLIYETLDGKSFKARSKHRNAVYYIKREAEVDGETYYLLSTSPSATRGVVGWMKTKDVSTHSHISVTKTPKQMAIKGTGKATSKAWGGSKDTVHSSLSQFKGQTLHINLTEKVGNNTWYRGKINNNGANVWLHSSQTQAIQTNSNSRQVIVLDAGHGGSDPGASRNGVVEKEVVLDVTLRAEKILKARGFRVILTRSTDTFINLSERSNIANRNKASSFLSIHANSGGGIGTETWWYNRNNAASSKKFAQVIQNAVVNSTKARDRGIKHGNLSVNRESNMTSALLEIGFVDSMTEAQQLKRPAYRNQIAIGIANGFDNYYK